MSWPNSAQRGIGLIELMIGVTVGLIVAAGASVMLVRQLAEHHRLMLEAQLQQDLRAVADLLLRELRRAGYWSMAQKGVWADGATAPLSNVYTATVPAKAQDSNSVEYSYSRADAGNPEDNLLDPGREQFGFMLESGILKLRLGNSWQPLTDKSTLTITGFNVRLNVQELALDDYCNSPCAAGSLSCPPQLQLRRFDVTVTGRATTDPALLRRLTLSSKLRNDLIKGSC
jgi:prepilin peptidase dependent protein B